jgi:hypothetical protein
MTRKTINRNVLGPQSWREYPVFWTEHALGAIASQLRALADWLFPDIALERAIKDDKDAQNDP